MKFLSIFFLLSILMISLQVNAQLCHLSNKLKQEIKSYRGMANYIVRTATSERYAGTFHKDLVEFIDKFGPRVSGTSSLKNAIEYLYNKTILNGLTAVKEPVPVPHWIRIKESATLLKPEIRTLRISALQFSPPTIPIGLTSELIIVPDFKDMMSKKKKIEGKIVFINYDYSSQDNALYYEYKCAEKALEVKAIAVLIRSAAPRKSCSPHTGLLNYLSGKLIPAAALSVEDSELLARFHKKKKKMFINLIILSSMGAPAVSHNLIFDYIGTPKPHELITVSGHIDSYDVGKGVMDNAGGALLALHTILLLKFIRARHKRTVRGIMWTGKEQGTLGAKAYMLTHAKELLNWTIALSSDEGLFEPKGFKYHGPENVFCVMREVILLFQDYFPNLKLEYDKLNEKGDIHIFSKLRVPLLDLVTDEEYHFSRMHSINDVLTSVDPKLLDKNLGIFAGIVYVLSNLNEIPKNWLRFLNGVPESFFKG